MTSVEESIDAHKAKNAGSDDADKTNLIKSLNVSNAEALESRVRRELEEQVVRLRVSVLFCFTNVFEI